LWIKHTPEDILEIEKDLDGKIIFLEKGNQNAWFAHIFEQHGSEFLNKWIQEKDIWKFIITIAKNNRPIGAMQNGRKVYKISQNGIDNYYGIEISTNWFIVSAQTLSIDKIVTFY
jgi:filamentous hemagglutinin